MILFFMPSPWLLPVTSDEVDGLQHLQKAIAAATAIVVAPIRVRSLSIDDTEGGDGDNDNELRKEKITLKVNASQFMFTHIVAVAPRLCFLF